MKLRDSHNTIADARHTSEKDVRAVPSPRRSIRGSHNPAVDFTVVHTGREHTTKTGPEGTPK